MPADSSKLDALTEAMAKTQAQVAVLASNTQSHHKTLYGNGRPGLASRMDRLESALESNLRTLRWLVGLAVTILISTATIAAGIIW